MKRRNEFLRFTRLHHEDDGTGGNSDNTELDATEDEHSDASDVIDKVKEEVDYKELLRKQQEQIELLLSEKEERLKKVVEKPKKQGTLTLEDLENFYEKKDKERKVIEKLAGYGLSGEDLNKMKGLPADALDVIFKSLSKSFTLPNTRKVGDGKSGHSDNIVSVEDMLNKLEEMKK